MGISANKQVALDFLEALRSENFDKLRAVIKDDIAWWLPPSTRKVLGFPDAVRGADNVIKFVKSLLTSTYQSDDQKQFIIREIVAENNLVAVRHTLRTVSPQGLPYENEYFSLSRIENAKLAEQWTYTDTAHTYEDLVTDDS